MNDGQACCSCLTVKYDPEEVEIYVEEFSRTMPGLRERWSCAAGCGSHFIRKTAADILRERLEAAQGNWSREVSELGEQIERLRAALLHAYIDGGCRDDEAEEMVQALSTGGNRNE